MPKIHIIPIVLDLSGSMNEKEPGTNKTKKEIAVEHIVNGLCNVVTNEKMWSDVASKAHRVFIGIGVFGVSDTDEDKQILMSPLSLLDLKDMVKDKGCNKLKDELISKVNKINSDGTSAVQLVNAIIKLLQQTIEQYKPNNEVSFEPRITALIYTDGCFNIFRDNDDDKYEGTRKARDDLNNEINSIVLGISSRPENIERVIRGIILLLYGDKDRLELDDGICPKRASLFASELEKLHPTMRNKFKNLIEKRVLSLDDDIAELEVEDGKSVADYAVARVEDPANLAIAISTLTTTAPRGG